MQLARCNPVLQMPQETWFIWKDVMHGLACTPISDDTKTFVL